MIAYHKRLVCPLHDELAGEVLPSELAGLWDEVEAENSFFCAAVARLSKATEKLAMKLEKLPAALPEKATAPA